MWVWTQPGPVVAPQGRMASAAALSGCRGQLRFGGTSDITAGIINVEKTSMYVTFAMLMYGMNECGILKFNECEREKT